MRNFFKTAKGRVMMAMLSVMAVMICSLNAFAESSGSANSAVTSAMTTVANDMVATGNSIIPIALTVVGLAIVVVFGIRMFKKIAK